MSNLPIFVAIIGVCALIFGILKDFLFHPAGVLLAILGIIVGSLITLIVTGDSQ